MKACVTTTRTLILVNGSPTAEFNPERGLRQGDPLSPFLFIIVVGGLNILLAKAKELGILKGVPVGNCEETISHLQFADDTIVFCKAEWVEVLNVKRILRCFEIMSGLKINYHKSNICGMGVPDELVTNFASRLNCMKISLPFTYLGLLLGANPRRKSIRATIIEKCQRRLASWKKRFLSFGGRLTLIKSVLSSLPVYYVSFQTT